MIVEETGFSAKDYPTTMYQRIALGFFLDEERTKYTAEEWSAFVRIIRPSHTDPHRFVRWCIQAKDFYFQKRELAKRALANRVHWSIFCSLFEYDEKLIESFLSFYEEQNEPPSVQDCREYLGYDAEKVNQKMLEIYKNLSPQQKRELLKEMEERLR